MYTFWLNNKSRASYDININLWFLNSIRQYLVLSASQISYFVSSLDSLKLLNLKTTKTYYDFLVVYKFLFLLLFVAAAFLVILSL